MLRTLIVLPLAALTLAAADPSTPEVVLARMRQAQSSVVSLTARLEQVKSYPQLGIVDPAERGTFTMARTKRGATRVRMEILEPETRILTVADGKYLLYQPRIKQAVEGKLSGGGKKGLFSGILTGSPEALEELERDYRVESVGETIVSEASVIELRFTARANAAVYCQQIDLWVDTTSWLPVQQSCHEANQSVITFTLGDVKLNLPLKKDAFDVDLPSDVEKLRG
ncbi:MAG: hypothetical protein BMS9Abin37_2900 [Acidobacteriota bacterium]|nr:MAG: hypothetical protein BMS9Abin37_2900 [Acidobacteriota bacterium]